ncbi:MAG: protein-L-isoaspartate O-methyltransferase [Gammaproteobacteria bacterium]|jgi:protein-L-isoaspartate(D-aspartate) O-methyltransferase|nr:protein-L-isoaspartate O-methyltransferase [Gammaproteobacteria bacterium]MBT7523909.1 protein-L-isoaspartate O-methyltransferase [Gammaproteobacteria bacterium]MBT7815028.1 protein-L-isoaspartate O-methyltransferase [Gammaproteobacteria bacterium]
MQIDKKNMIESQLKPEGISCQNTIDCISKVNREDFVPEEFKNLSYAEYDIPLRNEYSMLKPLMTAKILQLLNIDKDDEILEIGTGSGYLTCCLSIMGKSVDTLDIDANMLESAKKSHNHYNIFNVNYLSGDVFSNWTPEKNYDVIVLTGSIESRVEKLEVALKDSGRMFAVIGKQPVMYANIIERVSGTKLLCNQSFETTLESLNNFNKKNYLNF